MAKTIKAVFSSGVFARTLKVFEWDTDDKLQFVGIDLPDNYTVDFSNSLTGESKPVLGDASGVAIPPEYFVHGTEIYAWVWISTENGGHTKYQVTIPVYKRAKRTDTTPTPAQQDALDQAIAALNAAVTDVQDQINDALQEAKDSGEFDGPPGEKGDKGDTGIVWTSTQISLLQNVFAHVKFDTPSALQLVTALVNSLAENPQWNADQIAMLDTVLDHVKYTDETGDEVASMLITALRGGVIPAVVVPSTAEDVGAVAENQGIANAGKFLVVGNDGNITTQAMTNAETEAL